MDSTVYKTVFKEFDLSTLTDAERDMIRRNVSGSLYGEAVIPHPVVVVNKNGESDPVIYKLEIFK